MFFLLLNFNNDFIRIGRSHRNNHKCRVNSKSIVVQNRMGTPHAHTPKSYANARCAITHDTLLRYSYCFEYYSSFGEARHSQFARKDQQQQKDK